MWVWRKTQKWIMQKTACTTNSQWLFDTFKIPLEMLKGIIFSYSFPGWNDMKIWAITHFDFVG